jgi:hypothetical protein
MEIGEHFLIFPFFVLVAVFGYLTADRLNISLDVTWLLIAQVIFYAAVLIALTYLRDATGRLNHLADEAPDGPVTEEITAEIKKPLPAILGSILTVGYFFIVYLMVSKPAW